MKRRELDEIEVDILAHLLENGEQRFIEIAEALFPKHEKTFYHDERHFKVVLVRKLEKLKEEKYIGKKIYSHKNVCYFIPKNKKEHVAKMVKDYRNSEYFNKLSQEEKERLIKYHQLRSRLLEILNEPLPGMIIEQKLQQLGYKPSDYKLRNVVYGEIYDLYTPEDIIFEIVPCSEKDFQNLRAEIFHGHYYKPVAYIKSEKKVVLAGYKAIDELAEQIDEIEVELVKIEFDLTSQDVKRLDQKLLKIFPLKGAEFWRYIASKKPNALQLFINHYIRLGYSERFAETLAKNELRFYQAIERDFKTYKGLN
ncbi:MAG: hypothetical protein QXR89_07910 [Candidatus Bathyarchaeia archaeon]